MKGGETLVSVNIASIEIDLTSDGLYLVSFHSKAAKTGERLLLKEIDGSAQGVAIFLEYFFKQFYEHFKVPTFESALKEFIKIRAETD